MFISKESHAHAARQSKGMVSSLAHEAHGRLLRRQYGYGYGYGYGYSGWSSYGRWIVLGVVVGIAVLVWLTICCCNRRRTRAGAQPVKYTGWATPGFQHPQQTGVTNTNSNYNTQPYVAPQQQQTTYPMQNYTQYPQTGYPAQNESYAQQPYQQGVYNTGNEYSQQPPSYPAAPAPVAGREK